MTEKAIVAVVVEPSTLSRSSLPPASADPVVAFLTRYTSQHSRRAMRTGLCVVGSLLLQRPVLNPSEVQWHQLRYTHLQELRARMFDKYAPTSVNLYLQAVRGVIRECERLELISPKDAKNLADVTLLKADHKGAGRALELEEVAKLMAACDATPAGQRDAAILVLAAGAGLRRAEIAQLDLKDWDPAEGKLKIFGKGGKWRTAYLNPSRAAVLKSWLLLRGQAPGAFVCPMTTQGALASKRRLTPEGVYSVLQVIGERAGVPDFTPHDLRRTYITRLLDKGVDALTVSQIAGHASVQTTLRYDKREERAKKAAALLDD